MEDIKKRFEDAIDKNIYIEGSQYEDLDEAVNAIYEIHREELDFALSEQQTQMNEVADEMANHRVKEFVEWHNENFKSEFKRIPNSVIGMFNLERKDKKK